MPHGVHFYAERSPDSRDSHRHHSSYWTHSSDCLEVNSSDFWSNLLSIFQPSNESLTFEYLCQTALSSASNQGRAQRMNRSKQWSFHVFTLSIGCLHNKVMSIRVVCLSIRRSILFLWLWIICCKLCRNVLHTLLQMPRNDFRLLFMHHAVCMPKSIQRCGTQLPPHYDDVVRSVWLLEQLALCANTPKSVLIVTLIQLLWLRLCVHCTHLFSSASVNWIIIFSFHMKTFEAITFLWRWMGSDCGTLDTTKEHKEI